MKRLTHLTSWFFVFEVFLVRALRILDVVSVITD